MTTLFYVDPELVIALNKKIIFVNPNDLQLFKEVEIPDDLTQHGLKVVNTENDQGNAEGETEQQQKTNTTQQEAVSIQHVNLSPSGQLLAVTTSGQKALLLYQCRPEHAKLISVRPLARASSALTFSKDSTTLLVTDKTGDCYQFDCVNIETPPRLLLGHLSIVYDVLWTTDSKYIITCDRDDKIRVTNYPATHDIHGYCLGHKEFVSALTLLKGNVIASVSGDKSLRLWDFVNRKELAMIELPAPGLRLALRALDENKFQLAVVLHQPEESVVVYDVIHSGGDVWDITEADVLNFPSVLVSNLCYANERLYVAGIIEDHFTLKLANTSDSTAAPDNWLKMVDEQFKDEIWKPEDVSTWFKKRYDNVSEYLERKKRRIEEKQK